VRKFGIKIGYIPKIQITCNKDSVQDQYKQSWKAYSQYRNFFNT